MSAAVNRPVMTEEAAYLIVRCINALCEEGIGPSQLDVDPAMEAMDNEMIDEAIRIAGHRLPEYARWWIP